MGSLSRRDIPEYPIEAIREAVVNAVAHRDYSHFVRGSYVQIRLFADRLEIQSPGGLYGNVTEETIEEEQSTLNRVLMRLMEDLHIVENRGSGIKAMIDAMRNANLEPPRLQDRRNSFLVTFRNHTLMSPDVVAWLNQVATFPLNDHQRLALVYLNHNEQITNSDYQRLNHVSSVIANRDLGNLVQLGAIEQHKTRRWAYYTLLLTPLADSQHIQQSYEAYEEKIIRHIREHGSINNSQCRKLLDIDLNKASHFLKKMKKLGLLKRKGERRWARYHLP